MSELDQVVEHFLLSAEGDKDMAFAKKADAELKALRERNEELEEYHRFYLGIIPEGEETVKEKRFRLALEEAKGIMNAGLVNHADIFGFANWLKKWGKL